MTASGSEISAMFFTLTHYWYFNLSPASVLVTSPTSKSTVVFSSLTWTKVCLYFLHLCFMCKVFYYHRHLK